MEKSKFASLADKWPSTFVAREKVAEFSGGMLNPRTLANRDSKGQGPEGKILLGKRKVAYSVDALIKYLDEISI